MCHREERGDLGCSELADRQKRDCFAGNSVIARNVAISVFYRWRTEKKRDCFAGSQPPKGALTRCVIARNVAISVVQSWQTDKREVASQGILSSRGTWRSRLFGVGKQPKERLLRSKFCHREVRSNLGCSGLANSQERDCDAGNSVIARNVAISVVRGWQTTKREIAALRSQ